MTSRCQINAEGLYAAAILSSFLRLPPEIIQRTIISIKTPNFIDFNFHTIPNFDNRRVSPYFFDYTYRAPLSFLKTPLGVVIKLDEPFKDLFNVKIEGRCTGIKISETREKTTRVYTDLHPVHDVESLNVALHSPWLRFMRQVKDTPEGLQIEEQIESLRNTVKPAELLSPEFARLHKEYSEKIHGMAVIVKPLEK
jgi:hypothetical protein